MVTDAQIPAWAKYLKKERSVLLTFKIGKAQTNNIIRKLVVNDRTVNDDGRILDSCKNRHVQTKPESLITVCGLMSHQA